MKKEAITEPYKSIQAIFWFAIVEMTYNRSTRSIGINIDDPGKIGRPPLGPSSAVTFAPPIQMGASLPSPGYADPGQVIRTPFKAFSSSGDT
jgi:hypothetical protein